MSDRDHGSILAILEAKQHIRDYTSSISDAEHFYRNTMAFDATLMNFVLVGEMSRRISDGSSPRQQGQLGFIYLFLFKN